MVFFVTRGLHKKSYNPVFSENEWADIIEACHANEVPDEWVADGTCYKDMLIGYTNYRIDIIGKNHDDLADGTGKAPLTFQLHEPYSIKYPMNRTNTNSGGWDKCEMNTLFLPSFFNTIQSDVKDAIRDVKKKTSSGNMSSDILITNNKLFLLSEIEVDGVAHYSAPGEGQQYEYYRKGADDIGSNGWWLRSPCVERNGYFCAYYQSVSSTIKEASESSDIIFAFCI